MKKIRLFLVALIIVVLSVVSFQCIATAAEVSRINRNKGHVFINAGKDAGFILSNRVCFYSPSGAELLCGRVQRTTDAYAVVKVNNREVKKIKVGTEAKLYEETKEKNPKKDAN
jgi:ribosomal protein L35AE/L33A